MWQYTNSNELYHYGILGMKWGVRRYRNKDGSLTNLGKKRAAQFKTAGETAKQNANRAKQKAEDYKNAPVEFEKKYGGKDGWKKYLDDGFGDDWHDKEYMKAVFEINNVEKYAKDSIKSDLEHIKKNSQQMNQSYMDEAIKWTRTSEKFLNTPISKLSEKDFREAQTFAKRQMKKAR